MNYFSGANSDNFKNNRHQFNKNITHNLTNPKINNSDVPDICVFNVFIKKKNSFNIYKFFVYPQVRKI